MGGGGDDGGYEARQAEQEARKQAARDALNKMFGYAPSTRVAAPNIADFTTTTPGGYISEDSGPETTYQYYVPGSSKVDQAGYDAALAAYNSQDAEVGANKAAREALYQGVRDNAYTSGVRKLDEQRNDAQRKLKFELFARGLNGGSEDVNQNAILGRTYSQGLIDLGGKADAARADFRNSDESTRLGLLQSIDAGIDQGSALSSALSQQKINADRAAAEAAGTSLGDLFATGGEFYNMNQARLGKQAGADWWNQYSSGAGTSKKAPSAGTITSGAYYGG